MKTTITFTKCFEDVQDVGTEGGKEDRMVSRLFFTLPVAGKIYEMRMEIRQPHGFDFADTDQFPIETSLPEGGFKGPWHHESLNKAAEDYYRSIVGATGRMINFGPGMKNMRMKNNATTMSKQFEIELPDRGGTW